jgi:adenine-specific DNA-methyltransferase
MPSLNWIGKEAVTNHDKEVPFRLLKKIKTASVGDESQNLIIHGDNLEGLKALMPHYYGKVKCIYIDPPYNTGNENWVYNDKVNSPKIKQWLKKTVKIDDLTRHDKWLSMMYPRLKLLRDLLAQDGVIFISIDDNEHCHLKLLMDEVFGEDNFVGSFIWRKKEGGGQADANFVREHEYIMTFRKSEHFVWKDKIVSDDISKYNKEDSDGKYTLLKLAKWGNTARKEDRPSMHFPIIAPDGSEVLPIAPDGSDGRWRVGKVRMQELVNSGLVEFQRKNDQWQAYEKIYFDSDKNKVVKARSIIYDLANTADASNALTEIFGSKDQFDTPKPVELIKFLIKHSCDDEAIVLDSYAGSGTTGHAVLDLNKEDDGNRKFILVEMEDNIAKDITAERVKRAIKKYDYKDGFEYCELDKPLFDETGHIEKTCDFNQFATYIYFTETQRNIDKKDIDGNFIGEDVNTEFYLIYKEPKVNDLDKSFIKKLRKTEGKKVVYADRCMLDDETLTQYNIVFKQIPYEVKIY